MRIRQFINAHPDTTGEYIGLSYENLDGKKTVLDLMIGQADDLLLLIARAGVTNAQKHPPTAPRHGVEIVRPQPATEVDASYGPDGLPMIHVRFGPNSVAATLTNEQARALADQLGNLSVDATTGKSAHPH